ncbi:MAG: hypothetical protein ACK5MT_19615 [Actinomycetales bacterium]
MRQASTIMASHHVGPAADQLLPADTLERERWELGSRQAQVLTALLVGQTPVGFHPDACAATGRVLRGKRWRSARTAVPGLTDLPEARDVFVEFARVVPPRGCAHDDADAFLAWAVRRGRLGRAGEALWLRREVRAWRRSIALVRHPRPAIILALGDRVVEIGLWPWGARPGTC